MSGQVSRIRGQVRFPDGEPASGAIVSIVESSVPMPENALRTDTAGVFQCGVPRGRFVFEAVADRGKWRARQAVEATAGGGPLDVMMTLQSASGTPTNP